MPSYVVLVSPSVGGAERRFFDVFTRLRRTGADVALVGPSSLIDQLTAEHPERADVVPALIAVPMGAWSRPAFVRRYRQLLRTLPRGSRFHYPLNCLWFLHLGRHDTVSMSVADCTSVPGPFSAKRTSVLAWLAFFFVTKVDVLSPTIFAAMRGYSAAPKMSLTPGGTFLASPPESASGKTPTVVFLSRLVEGKGIGDLLDVVGSVWSALRDRVPSDFNFAIAGYGALAATVADRVQSLAASGVPISFLGYAAADRVLPGAAVLLSLQEVTNYPSRVVAEALMAGCAAIVRDTGDSREFGADLPGLVYCRARLDPEEIADQLAGLVTRVLGAPGFSQEIRRAASARFSADGYVDYFRDIVVGAS